ncbi:MAG: CotH kinase family protein [Bacteroidota bacterium]
MRPTTTFFLLFVLPFAASAQVVINELCASNDSVIEDEYGNSSDWLELYNAGVGTVDLTGFYLSDDLSDPTKWTFPTTQLASGEWLLIFASDRDEQATFLHTNFKLAASGENVILSSPDGAVVDQVSYENLATDHSWGRLTDASAEQAIFALPTPGFSNNESTGSGFTSPPVWETDTHYFPTPSTVTLSHPQAEAVLYYTLDGSIPTADDLRYTQPIPLDTTTALRVVAIAPEKLPSTVESRTFFVEQRHTLPVVSIVGEPDDFWSWERGILVHGGPDAEEEWPYWGANFWADVELPIHLEFFSADYERLFHHRADTKIHGGRGARTRPMKPLRLMFKEKYGSPTVEYPFFPDRERTTYKRLVLRNASGDYNNAHFRDAFLARYFIQENLNVDVLAHRPVVVYVNGAYYGLFNLREKSDEYYLKHNYGVDPDNLDLLEEESTVATGDYIAFDSMQQFAVTADLRQAANFERVRSFFDVENIAECFVVQSALNNGDWLHNNIKYWREREEGARWRYLLFDMDIAMGRHAWSDWDRENLDSLTRRLLGQNKHADLFVALLANEEFRHYFINRYADLLNTSFRPEIFAREVDRTIAELDPEMPQHFARWTWPGYDVWRDERTAKLYEYLEQRPPYARQHIRDYFELSGEVELQLSTYPADAGTIKINTIEPEELPWDGIYFRGVPITLSITPKPGYTFSHWASRSTIQTPDTQSAITYTFDGNDEVVAYFTAAPAGPQIAGSVVQNGVLPVQLGLPNHQRVTLALYDLAGRKIRQFPPQELGGEHRLDLPVGQLPAGVYWLRVQTATEVVSAPVLVVGE